METHNLKSKFKIKHLPKLLVDTYKAWINDDPWRLSAVVAYYAVLSLPGLLVIILNTVGSIWGYEIVQGELSKEIALAMGKDTAKAIEGMMAETLNEDKNLISTIIGVATILFGATGVFYQLQISLNKIWEVKQSDTFSFKKILSDRARSFAFILGIGFLLLISFVLTTVISALTGYIERLFPDIVLYLAYILDFLISVLIISTLFAMMFRYMPDVRVRWKTVWVGAILTAVLFVFGKFLLGIYFGQSNPGSTYGTAGSIVLVLLWVSYSCLIFFFGAEFTKVYAIKYGHFKSNTLTKTLN